MAVCRVFALASSWRGIGIMPMKPLLDAPLFQVLPTPCCSQVSLLSESLAVLPAVDTRPPSICLSAGPIILQAGQQLHHHRFHLEDLSQPAITIRGPGVTVANVVIVVGHAVQARQMPDAAAA